MNHSANQKLSESPDEPLFIPTLRCSPIPPGSFNRIYRTDSLSSDLSGTSHTSDNSYTHDANKKPKKRILKHPHEKKNDHRSKHVHWRLDEVEDSRYEDNTSLDSIYSDTCVKVPDIAGKQYNQGWNNNNDELSWNVNSQWIGRSAIDGSPDELDIDLPFDESYLPENTSVSSSHWQGEKLAGIPSHQLTISPSDDTHLADQLKQVQLQDTPTQLQAGPIQFIDTPAVDTHNLSSESPMHLPDNTTTLTSTPVVFRNKNGVTSTNSMPPVLKLRDSMVCELEESIYEGKPNMFQFPDASCNSSGSKASTDVHQLSPLLEDTASLPSVLKISEPSQLVESSVKSDSDQTPSSTCSDNNKQVHLDKDMMGQNIIMMSPVMQEQSPSILSSCGSTSDIKTMTLNTPSLSFSHTNSDSKLNTAKDFINGKPNHLVNSNGGSTSSLPLNLSYMNQQPKLQDNARMLSNHGSPNSARHQGSTSSLPAVTNGKLPHLDELDDIDTPLGELDANMRKTQVPVVRYRRHHSYGPEYFKANTSPTSSRAKHKLEAIMKDIELEENHRVNSTKPRNLTGQLEGNFVVLCQVTCMDVGNCPRAHASHVLGIFCN